MNKNQIIKTAYKLIIEEKDRAVCEWEHMGVYYAGVTDLAEELIEMLADEAPLWPEPRRQDERSR